MILLGSGDQNRIDVDTDHVVADGRKERAHPAGATTSVENPTVPRRHRVDESRLSGKIVAGLSHRPETLDVPGGVPRVGVGDLDPPALCNHPASSRSASSSSRQHLTKVAEHPLPQPCVWSLCMLTL